MRRALLAVVAILGSASGHAEGPAEGRKVALGESFTLRVGESALLEVEALRIGFQAVPTDSRCPKGENCIWEGDAIVRVWVQRGSGAKEERELHTSEREPGAADFESWTIRLVALDPYPVSGRTIRQADYIATLRVTRGSSAEGEIR